MQILASPSSGILGAFTDEFSSTLDPRYTATSGTWTVSSGDASTSTAASSYPLLSFDAGINTVSVRTEGGVTNSFGWGVAFWVVDSNNWWAAIADRSSYSCQVGSTTGCCACGSDQCGPDGSCACYSCSGGGCQGTCTFVAFTGTCTYPVFGTCYSYNLRLIRRSSGTISQISSTAISAGNIGASLTIGYVQVQTNSSGQITATAQMSTGGSIATITNTPVSPTRTTRHGILIAPRTEGTQSSSLERLVYTPA